MSARFITVYTFLKSVYLDRPRADPYYILAKESDKVYKKYVSWSASKRNKGKLRLLGENEFHYTMSGICLYVGLVGRESWEYGGYYDEYKRMNEEEKEGGLFYQALENDDEIAENEGRRVKFYSLMVHDMELLKEMLRLLRLKKSLLTIN